MCLLGTGRDYNAATARKLACGFGTRTHWSLASAKVNVPYAGHLSLATNLAALEHLAPDWRELQSASPHPHGIFQSLDWCLTWARIYARPEHGIEPCVVTGYQDGILVFVWPLMKVRQGPLTILRWLTDPFAQYGDVVVRPGTDARPWCRSAMELLRRLKGIDCLRLRHVRADLAIYPYLAENFHRTDEADDAPFLDLTAYRPKPNTTSAIVASSARGAARSESRWPPWARWTSRCCPWAASWIAPWKRPSSKRRWLAERGLYSRPLQCPYLEPFLRELSRNSNGIVSLVTSCLRAGSRPISWEIGLRFGQTHFGFITSHDIALTDARRPGCTWTCPSAGPSRTACDLRPNNSR